jgi:hypothetical protein
MSFDQNGADASGTCYLQDDGTDIRLVVEAISDDWLFLNSAYERGGVGLGFRKIDQQVLSYKVGVEEDVSINIPSDQLQTLRQDGLDLKLEGQRGDAVVKVPLQRLHIPLPRPQRPDGFRVAAAAPVSVVTIGTRCKTDMARIFPSSVAGPLRVGVLMMSCTLPFLM